MPEEKIDQMTPELLITYGGHVVSKRLKKFLRQHPPKEHWHISPDGEIVDLYGALTTVIEMDPFEFLEKSPRHIQSPQRMEDFPSSVIQQKDAQIGTDIHIPQSIHVIEEAQIPDSYKIQLVGSSRITDSSRKRSFDS